MPTLGIRGQRRFLSIQSLRRIHQKRVKSENRIGKAFSSSHASAHFGLGKAKQADRIEIPWPRGVEQVLTNVRANQVLEVTESAK